MPNLHQISTVEDARRYLFGCADRVTLTLVSCKTGTRFTYRARRVPDQAHFLFIDLLTGPENTWDYSYLGFLFKRSTAWEFRHGRKSRVQKDSKAVLGFRWLISRLNRPKDVAGGALVDVEMYHAGTCANCGRMLTTPESLQRGLGPQCFEAAQNRL